MPHLYLFFPFAKHSMAQKKSGKTSEFITLLKKWLQIPSTTTANATTLSCLALVWRGTVACQMLQKVVKIAASCQVTQDPGEDASTRCDSTKLGACTLVMSITLSSFFPKKWPSATFKTHGPGRVWTRREGGGGLSCEWFTSARNLRSDRSLPLPEDCPQYIPKGKPTPAGKLAFVTSCPRCLFYITCNYDTTSGKNKQHIHQKNQIM